MEDELRLVVALMAEARPLIQHLRLAGEGRGGPFRLFQRAGVALVVSGPGKVAAAAATSWLHLTTGGSANAAWLNVGVAGHRSRPVGEAVLAGRVVDAASGESWYPPLVFSPPVPVDTVITVDRPETTFPKDAAYDMEAAGFVPTACRFATAELVHCLKVISDGPGDHPGAGAVLTAERIEGLITARVGLVEEVATRCRELSRELRGLEADPPDFAACGERFRFSVSDGRELRRLLRRRAALAPSLPLPLDGLASSVRGKEVNRRLRSWLDELAFRSGTLDSPSALR